MGTKKSTRANRRKPAHARKRPAEHIPSAAERMQAILRGYKDHAFDISRNPLMVNKTPQEGLKACGNVVESLFRESFEREGKQYVYQMLLYALRDLETQLQPLFDCAGQVAGVQS
jgi:hypothetical protein